MVYLPSEEIVNELEKRIEKLERLSKLAIEEENDHDYRIYEELRIEIYRILFFIRGEEETI